jgi:hypothetical protein
LVYSFAREFFAVITKFGRCLLKINAIFYYTHYTRGSFRGRMNPTTDTFVFGSKIGHAGPAIHSTWGN